MKKIIFMMFLIVLSVFSKEIKRMENFSNVSEVSIDCGGITVEVKKSNEEKMELIGDEDRIKNILVKVSGNKLEIKEKNTLNWFSSNQNKKVKISISMKKLEKAIMDGSGYISISGFSGEKLEYIINGSGDALIENNNYKTYLLNLDGSGNIEIKGNTEILKANLGGSGKIDCAVNADKIDVYLDGSGEIYLEGYSKEFKGEIEGSGSLKASDLETLKATITINGSGNANIKVKEEFVGTIEGSGNIKYSGNPKIEKIKENGSGDIIKR